MKARSVEASVLSSDGRENRARVIAETLNPKNLLRLFSASEMIFYSLRLFLKTLQEYPLKQAED